MMKLNQISQLIDKKYLTLKDLEPFPDLLVLRKQLGITNARQILYHYTNNLTSIPICNCGNLLKWNSDTRAYRDFCSKKCTAIYTVEKRKTTSLEKYGVDHYSKTNEFNEQIITTSIAKYGVDHYSKTDCFQESVKNTNLKKYGVEFPSQLTEFKQKAKETNIRKYGVDNPVKFKEIQDKIANTTLEKYGVHSVLKSKEIQDKIKETNLKKYGVSNPRCNPEVSQQISKKRKENYYTPEVLKLLENPDWLRQQNESGKSVGEIANDIGVSSSNLCKYFEKYSIDIIRHWSSSHESKIIDLLDKHNIIYKKNYRKLISPFEIDIYIPEFKLAIEINGGFWHHEDAGKDKCYHFNKLKNCESLGIELWNIFDWEIEDKFEIIKSKLLHKLHLTSNKIPARKLEVKTISDKNKTQFLKDNHIQGNCASKINLGLFKEGILYAVMTFGKSRFNKTYDWELLRYCTLNNWAVPGGASRLLKYFINNHLKQNETLISYCNLRFSSGNLYKALKFQELAASPPNYFYVTKNGNYAGSRNQWQKHMLKNKLKIFDETLSELENMKLNGYHRIWDCGNLTFLFKKSST